VDKLKLRCLYKKENLWQGELKNMDVYFFARMAMDSITQQAYWRYAISEREILAETAIRNPLSCNCVKISGTDQTNIEWLFEETGFELPDDYIEWD